MILPLALLAAIQAGPAASQTAAAPERWSILEERCAPAKENEVLVCAPAPDAARMPLPDEREPPNRLRQPSNDPRAGLENSGRPCPPGGCTGVSLPLIPIITTMADGIGNALKRKHPGRGIPIPLD